MKTRLLTLLLAVFASIGVAFAATSGTCGDNLQWSYNIYTHALTITGSGAMSDWGYQYVPWHSLISEIRSVSLPDGLTSIGNHAFYRCTGLTSVTIPNSVTSIGDYAFQYCTGLTSVTIPNSVTSIGVRAFEGCTGLTSLTIPNSVTSIGDYAFWNCTGLTSVTIPNSVTSIGAGAFEGCTGLTSIDIPNSVTSIGNLAFYGCTGLTSITIPNSVTSIGDEAFRGCTSLTSVTIPNSVTSIGNFAFYGCTGLTSVNITDIVAWYGISFYSCYSNPLYYAKNLYLNGTKVTDLVIPDGVTSIGDYAFWNCTGLTSIDIPNSVTSIGYYAFRGCTAITDLVWNMKSCPDYASSSDAPFYDSRASVQTFTFGNAVENIPAYLCYEMSGLTDINVPNSVKKIGVHVFDGCNELVNLTLGNGLQDIADYAFAGCKRLEQIIVYAERVIDLTQYSFDNVGVKSLLPVYVPEARLNNYKRDIYWSEFDLQVMSAGSTVTTDVSVTPHYTTADVVWPSVTDAATYELTITSGGVIVCTLIFNAQGQLTSIAFHAPAAERQNAAASQQGFAFTVTGLEDGSAYSLTINAKDANDNVIKTFSQDFTTGATALESVDADGASLKPRKILENGRVIILMPDGRKFDANGRALGK